MADSTSRPIPLVLSEEAPPQAGDQSSCRKCARDFIPLLARSRNCHHCGYAYCHACSETQALMRKAGSDQGVERVHVCASCYELLLLTASRKADLRSQPLAKLKHYLTSYGLQIPPHAVEKDDLVDIIISARNPSGALSAEAEGFYRRNKVPKQAERRRGGGMFGRGPVPAPSATPTSGEGRRAPASSGATPSQENRRARPHSSSQNTFPNGIPPYQPRASPESRRPAQAGSAGPTPRPSAANTPPPRPRPQPNPVPPQYRPPPGPPPNRQQYQPPPGPPPPAPQPRRPDPVIPALSELLAPETDLPHLSIGILKGILERNHVNTHLLVEKADLVDKVKMLVEQERRERERVARMHEREEEEERRRRDEMEQIRREERERHEREARTTTGESVVEVEHHHQPAHEHAEDDSGEAYIVDGEEDETEVVNEEDESHPVMESASSVFETPPPPAPPSIPTPATAVHHAPPPAPSDNVSLLGLCVVCQDDEANIAIVDCGHLALCLACSELIMETTRECPLCRTRIVTQQRLLRIYRT